MSLRGAAWLGVRALLPLLGVAALPAVAAGQADACVARVPDDSLVRVVVYLEPSVPDSARAALPSADLVAQLVRDRVHVLLGAGRGTLPVADSVATWHELERPIDVTLHRDGRFTARDAGTSGVARLVGRALAALDSAGERVFWPDSLPGDSLTVALQLHHPRVYATGGVEPLRVRVAIPVFSLPVPRVTPVVQTREPRIAYPQLSKRIHAVGSVTLDFVVDETGRVDSTTVREVWPDDEPRLGGELGQAYTAFVRAAREGLREARYEPATRGGCPMRWQARQSFHYRFR